MGKSLRDLIIDDTTDVAELPAKSGGLRSLVVDDEPVKKKESSLPSFANVADLKNVLPKYDNGTQDISQSKSELQLPSDTNHYNQILGTQDNKAKRSFDDAADFISRDIDFQFATKLSNANTASGDKYSIQNNQQQPDNNTIEAQTAVVQKDALKGQILSNPDELKKYRQARQSEIDTRIDELKQQSNDIISSQTGADANIVIEPNLENDIAYKDNQEAISTYENHKSQLQKSVSDVAKVSIGNEIDATVKSGKPVDIESVGKKYLQVIGDPQIGDDEKVLSGTQNGIGQSETVTVENGKVVPTNQKDIDLTNEKIKYKLYSTGANVMSDYYATKSGNFFQVAKPKIETLSALFSKQESAATPEEKNIYQNQINNFLTDPDIKNYLDATRSSIDFYDKNQKAADQFPQVKRQQIRQRLNDAFFELNKVMSTAESYVPNGAGVDVLHYLFGATPYDEQIPLLAKIAGVSEEEAKSIYEEKVKGFIGESPTGIRVSGFAQGLAKGTDETLAKSLMGIRRFVNTDNAETNNRILQDKLTSYGIEAQSNKLKDELNKWNINPYSIFNTMGRGIGQTAVFAAPALITGGLTAEGSLAQKIIEGSATVASGYAGSYEDAYKEAAQYTGDEKLRRVYANITAYENALPELLLSPAEIAKKVGVDKALSKNAFESFAKDVAENGVEATIKNRVIAGVKEFANVVGAENIEEQVTNITNNKTKENLLGVKMSNADLINQAIETAVQTTIITIPLGIGAGINANNDISGIRKQGLFEAGNEPDLYKEKLKTLLDNGSLNEAQYNQKVQVVNTMQNIVAKVNQTTKADGKPLTYDEKADLAAQEFRIANNNNLKKKGALVAQESHIEHDNADALERSNAILFGTNQTQPYYAITDKDGTVKPITRDEAVSLLAKNESDGLTIAYDEVLQKELEAQGGKNKTSVKIPEIKNPSGNPEEISQPIELNPNITGNIATEPQIQENGKGNSETNAATQTEGRQEIGLIQPEGAVENIVPSDFKTENTDTATVVSDKGSPYGTIAADYLFTGGKDAILSSDYLIQALSGAFENAGGLIEQIRNKYAKEIADNKLGDLKDFIGTDLYNTVMADIKEAINKSYNNKDVDELFNDILKYPTGVPIKEGHRISSKLDSVHKSKETNNTKNSKQVSDKPSMGDENSFKNGSDVLKEAVKKQNEIEQVNINPLSLEGKANLREVTKQRSKIFDGAARESLANDAGLPYTYFDNLGFKEWRDLQKEVGFEDVNKENYPELVDRVKAKFADDISAYKNENSQSNETKEAKVILPTKDEGVAGTSTELNKGAGEANQGETISKPTEETIPEKTIPVENIQPTVETGNNREEKKLSDKLRDKAAQIRKEGVNSIIPSFLKADLDESVKRSGFIGGKFLDEAVAKGVELIADAIDKGASISEAISAGFEPIKKFFKDNTKSFDEEKVFSAYEDKMYDLFEEPKPKKKVRVVVGKTENAEPINKSAAIDDYELTTSNETNKFLSGSTWNDIFGEMPEGNQSYAVQKLSDMLQDGKNMIALAQQKWGNDIMEYGKNLFSFIQSMSNDAILTNKKAVLLATFLGEIKEASLREPKRFNEIKQLENVVMAYYQNYMNLRGKEVVAGRLLRLYRDKYIGDIFADRILEEKETKEKNTLLKAEEEAKKIDDLVAEKVQERLTEQEKRSQDNAADKKSKSDAKKQSEKKNMSQKEAQQKANAKLKEIENNLGEQKDKGLVSKIKDLIDKLNCK